MRSLTMILANGYGKQKVHFFANANLIVISSRTFFLRSASVENVIDADFIHCYCFDSGNFKTLSLDKIRTLPNQFRQLPKLAMKAKLHGELACVVIQLS